MACSRCGAELPGDARFCPSCGAPVATAAVTEERKFVSVLFVDVVDSTARADGADPEDVRDLNQLYYREVSGRIQRHGGSIEKYVGDAVMAVFGAPLARSDDAERAVRASLSILEGIADLNERDPDLDLRVRAAICTGEAMVAVDAAPFDALATGDVVNTAARLQSSAPIGGVVVDAETYLLTRHAFDYRELDAVDAKGKRDPVPAWLVERRGDNVVLNYSTLTLRDIFWLDEALERSTLVADRLGPSDFNMPWMNARADIICAELLLGDIASVERSWNGTWDDTVSSHGWERWLIKGRLASVRADVELETGRLDEAVTWAQRSFELARTARRRKYEIASLITLGSALTAQGHGPEALDALRTSVALADGPGGSPLLRWRARAGLGAAAAQRAETAAEGEAEMRTAASTIHEIAGSLAPERAERYVAAPQVARVLEAAS